MPKFVGTTTPEELQQDLQILVVQLENPPAHGRRVRLASLRAMARREDIPFVVAVMDRSDKGFRGRVAKRWWRWYLPAGK